MAAANINRNPILVRLVGILGVIFGVITISLILILDHRDIIHFQSAHNFREEVYALLSDPSTITSLEAEMDMKFMKANEYNDAKKEIDDTKANVDLVKEKLEEVTKQMEEKQNELATLKEELNKLKSDPKLGLDKWCGTCRFGNTICDGRVKYLKRQYNVNTIPAKINLMKKGRCKRVSNTQKPDYNTQPARIQVQDSHGTSINRYPDEYSAVKKIIDGRWNSEYHDVTGVKLLSFGSSTGEEAISLATLYFNNTKYAQKISIYGVDIDEPTLKKARDNANKHGSQIQSKITFFNGKDVNITAHGKYDVIFANSVLCFHPKPLHKILAHFPFDRYEATLQSLDASLKDGGILAMVNMNYNFEETALSNRYTPLAKCETNFVPRIKRDTNKLLRTTGKIMDCIWVKNRSV